MSRWFNGESLSSQSFSSSGGARWEQICHSRCTDTGPPFQWTVPDQESYRTTDAESIHSSGGISDMEGEVEVASASEPPLSAVAVPVERFNGSFEWLAGEDLEAVSRQRPYLMKSVLGFMNGAYRSAT